METEVVALEIGGQFLFDMADHRDFLGAIVNLGITRDGVRCGRLFHNTSKLLEFSKETKLKPPDNTLDEKSKEEDRSYLIFYSLLVPLFCC